MAAILADGIPDRVTVALRFPRGSWRHRTAAAHGLFLIVGVTGRLWLKPAKATAELVRATVRLYSKFSDVESEEEQ